MKRDTIFYIPDQVPSNIPDQAPNSNSVLAALEATGYQVVSVNSPTQAMALLFVMHTAAAVVLDQRAREQASFDQARSLRAVRRDVPIILLSREPIDCLPSWVDACVSAREPLEKLTSTLRMMLNVESAVHDHQLLDCLRHTD